MLRPQPPLAHRRERLRVASRRLRLRRFGERRLTYVERRDAEKQIADKLFALRHMRPKAVACPNDMKAKQGKTYRCTLSPPPPPTRSG